MKLVKESDESKKLIENLKNEVDKFSSLSMMCDQEREFLAELIMQYRPKKILEIGVDAGGSSLIILNAIKDMKDSILHSMDYLKDWRGDHTKKTGFLVDDCPDLKNKWKLYTGGMVANFLDEIGRDIDLCFIDTSHVLPGEIIDFLLVLPYLKKDAIVCIHDVNMHTYKNCEKYLCNGILISAISGEKLLPNFFVDHGIDNFVNSLKRAVYLKNRIGNTEQVPNI